MSLRELPSLGLGTLRNTKPDDCAETVADAIDIGYRHIDTAQKYDNESYVGDGIEQANIPRSELFLASKIEEGNLDPGDVLETAKASLNRLGVETLDLLYIHWPAISSEQDRYDPEDTIPAFNQLIDEGRVRHFGVANFSIDLIEEAREHASVPIFANQVEMHPLLQQDALVDYAQTHDMYLVAYCPLLRGDLGRVPELDDIATKHGVTPAQVSLAWLMSKDNVIPIPKGRGPHLAENFEARHLELNDEDIATIDGIDREHRIVDRAKGPWQW